MGRLTIPGVLGVDANCFIYLFEAPGSERGRRVQEMFVEPTTSAVVTSVLTIAEVLIKPLRDGSEQEANDLREAVVAIPRLEIIDVNVRVAETAARIRRQRTSSCLTPFIWRRRFSKTRRLFSRTTADLSVATRFCPF